MSENASLASTRSPAQLVKLCDVTDWDDPDFIALSGDIMGRHPSYSVPHRKLWEFTKLVQSLDQFDLLREGSCGLSVAAGSERVLFYLTHFVSRLAATDIYGVGEFIDNEADDSFLKAPHRFAPYEYPRERLKSLYMDALNLEFPADTFDFAFSLSSVEHFGDAKEVVRALQEMNRVVRPGGIVMITTECSLNGKKAHDLFLPSELRQIIRDSGLRLVEEIDFGIDPRSLECVLDMRRDSLDSLPHITLKSLGAVFTSISLVFQKEGDWNEVTPLSSRLESYDSLINELAARDLSAIPPFSPPSVRSRFRRKAQSISYRLGSKFGPVKGKESLV